MIGSPGAPTLTRPEQAALGLLDELPAPRRVGHVPAADYRADGVSGAALSAWSRHDGWPSMWPLARVAAAVGMQLAWQPEAEPRPGLAPMAVGNWRSRSGPPPDSSVRGWWPGRPARGRGGGVAGAAWGGHRMAAGCTSCGGRWPSARAAEVDVLTWKSVEAAPSGVGKASRPDWTSCAGRVGCRGSRGPPRCPVPLPSVGAASMRLCRWPRGSGRVEARDNLTLRHFRQARGRRTALGDVRRAGGALR